MDRVTGMFIGALRGILLSYVLFFAVHLYCHTVYDKKEGEPKIEAEDILPNWIINSHSYQALFVTTEEVINMYVPESLILKIKEIGEEMVDQEKSQNNKEK